MSHVLFWSIVKSLVLLAVSFCVCLMIHHVLSQMQKQQAASMMHRCVKCLLHYMLVAWKCIVLRCRPVCRDVSELRVRIWMLSESNSFSKSEIWRIFIIVSVRFGFAFRCMKLIHHLQLSIICCIQVNKTTSNSYLLISVSSVLWLCWLGGRKGIRPVKIWVVGCGRGCLGWGADLHIAQQMPLPLTIPCSSKSRLVLTFLVLAFWYLLTRVVPDIFQKSSKTVVCVCVCMISVWY